MAFRTITARFPGRCRRCGDDIEIGTRVRYGGRGRTYHLVADCPAGGGGGDGGATDSPYADDRFASVTIFRNGEGTVIGTRNRRGRCEDSPCCGCCSGDWS